MSRVFERMIAVYDYLIRGSEIVDAQDYFQFGVPRDISQVTIWRGHAQQIATAMNVSQPLIAQTLVRLHHVESIRMVIRGSAVNPSVYLLLYRPTLQEYQAALERSNVTGKFTPTSAAQRAQDAINRVNQRLSEIEKRLERIELVQKSYALRDSERRDGTHDFNAR